jgi:hypothetical protein
LPSRGDRRAVHGHARVVGGHGAVSAAILDRRGGSTGSGSRAIDGGFQENWRQALTLIRRARAGGLQVTAVLADAEFGDITAFRRVLHQGCLPYALECRAI